jgi:hypothetical protein
MLREEWFKATGMSRTFESSFRDLGRRLGLLVRRPRTVVRDLVGFAPLAFLRAIYVISRSTVILMQIADTHSPPSPSAFLPFAPFLGTPRRMRLQFSITLVDAQARPPHHSSTHQHVQQRRSSTQASDSPCTSRSRYQCWTSGAKRRTSSCLWQRASLWVGKAGTPHRRRRPWTVLL